MPEHHYVSPTIAIDDWNSGRKTDVDVFEDQLSGWIFAPARVLHPNQHNGTALLLLLTPYFEMIASFLRGTESKGKSTRYLRYGLRRVLPDATRASIEAYIRLIAPGGPGIPAVDPAAGNLGQGLEVFAGNCAACHGAGAGVEAWATANGKTAQGPMQISYGVGTPAKSTTTA